MMQPHSTPSAVVDNGAGDSQMSSSSFPASMEDFFNMDMLATGSAANPAVVSGGASSSRASSHSPSDSFAQLPPTPPQHQFASFDTAAAVGFGGLSTIEEDSLFNFNFDDGVDYLKNDPMAALSSSAPFDFLGGFIGGPVGGSVSSGSNSGASPSASTSGASATQTPFSGFSIDPQLMGTSGPSSAASNMGDEEEEGEDDEEAEEEEAFLAPMKVGGKGKGRKGTVQSGAIVKKVGASEKKDSKRMKEDFGEPDSVPDDWRPSPEEYQKMSSKEKRQLRNKISARNFRVRRKEYISTLEGDIAERDKLIDAIRSELGSTKSENSALRQEVAALKKAILEGRASPMLPPPAPLSPMSPVATISPLATSISANTQSSSSSSNNLLKVNTAKDLPTSPRLAATGSAFWGGQSGGFGTFGGITPVHTTLIPEYGFGMSQFVGKPSAPTSNDSNRANENMNPGLNHVSIPIAVAASKVFASGSPANNSRRSSSPVLSTMPAPATSNTLGSEASNESINNYNHNLLVSQLLGQSHGFDAFSDINPFTLKTLDSYRMQLWGRVAAQQGSQRFAGPSAYNGHSSANTSPSSSPSPNGSPNPSLYGLASNLRPLFFTTPTSSRSSLSSLLSGKPIPSSSSHTSYPTPPASPTPTQRKEQAQTSAQQQQMQQALFASLASQTLLQKMGHAFWDAFSGQSASSSPKSWDAEKVRKVLDGSAVLKVVDVEPSMSAKVKVAAAPAPAEVALEESMRGMSLGGSSKEKESMSFLRCAKGKMSCGKTA